MKTSASLTTLVNEPADERLPSGWQSVSVGELITESLPGFACGERDPNGVIQLRMNNVDIRGNMRWDEFIRVPCDQSLLKNYRLVVGDVLFNNTNSTDLVGKSALFTGHDEPIVYSNHFTRLRPLTSRLLPEYLAMWLMSEWQRRTFAQLCNRWIGQSAVKNGKLLSLAIPLPPLQEQHYIVGILKCRFEGIALARKAAEDQLAAIDALPAALLRQALAGELR